jgi:membrane protein YdbS with pleckstrin-like domain
MAEQSRSTTGDNAMKTTSGGTTPASAAPGASLAELPSGDGAPAHPAAEAKVWTGRMSWKHFAGRLTLWLLACLAVVVGLYVAAERVDWLTGRVAVWIGGVAVAASGFVVLGGVMLAVLNHRYRLTSQRLFIERGILSRTIDQTELIRVDDVRVYQSLADRLFGLGTVGILSTDATDREIRMEGIADPHHVAEAVRTHMRSLRRKSLFVENL